MKTSVVYEPGAAPVYADFADPVVGSDQAEVELVAAGIHNVARARVSGQHYSSRGGWPAVPGVDAVARTPDGRRSTPASSTHPGGRWRNGCPCPRSSACPCPRVPIRWPSPPA